MRHKASEALPMTLQDAGRGPRRGEIGIMPYLKPAMGLGRLLEWGPRGTGLRHLGGAHRWRRLTQLARFVYGGSGMMLPRAGFTGP